MICSVIIPCYNCEGTLAATVDSVRAAGLTDYELLLVDDGSTDGTGALCRKLADGYPEVRWVRQDNAGVSAARNRGMDEARGDYIWFVDADDLVLPMQMEPIREAMRQGVDCVMFGMRFLHTRQGRVILQETLSCGDRLELTPQTLGEAFPLLFRRNYLSAIWNKFIRRELLLRHRLRFDPELTNYEDLHFSLLLLACCQRVIALPEVYYDYINTFGHDRTVDRVREIPDVIAYTDRIVRPLFALDERLRQAGGPPLSEGREIALTLYLEAIRFKLQTADGQQRRALCDAVRRSEYLRRNEDCLARLPQTDRRLYRWVREGAQGKIQLFMRYRALRGAVGRARRIAKSYRRP